MTISSTTNRNDYIGNNTTDTYNYSFKIFTKNDLLVTQKDINNVETTLTVDTDYTVTGLGESSGGTIVLTAGNLATGYTLTIRRVLVLLQSTDIRSQGDFYPEAHENQFDKLVMIDQQQQDELDRSLKLSESYDSVETNLRPEASKFLAWNESADGITNVSASDGSSNSVTATDSTTSRLLSNRFADIVNVKDYGAVGNGTTDDQAGIDAAITAASTNKTIFFPYGTYKISSALNLSGRVFFEPGSKIKPDSGIAVTCTSTCLIHSFYDWQDTSAGGTFSISAGAWEERYPTRTTSPTGGRILHIGFPGNSIDESSTTSFIFGGSNNFEHSLGESSSLSVIGGGYDNSIGDDAIASTIAGGAHHIVADGASHASILGGAYQTVNADYGVAVGGTLNTVESTYSFIGGGQSNIAGDSAQPDIDTRSAFVGAGNANAAKGIRSAIVGGNANTVSNEEGFIGAGASNTVSADNASVVGGASNTASGTNSSVLGGNSNVSSGLSSTAMGDSCTASGNYSVAHGEFTEASSSYSRATGSRSKANKFGQRAHASGYFSTKGDAQISELVARLQTSNATPSNLDLFGGASNPITIPDDTTWGFCVYVVARRTDANDESAFYEIKGCIDRNSGVATTALVGSLSKTVIAEDTAAWDVTITADTTNGALKITVTGEDSKTINWVARVELTEVTG